MRTLIASTCAGAVLLGAVWTLAQPPQPPPPPPPPRPGESREGNGGDVKSFLARLLTFDANQDGKLSKDELTDTRLQALFDRSDANHDGSVTKEELTKLYTKESAALGPAGRGGPGGPGGRGDRGPRPPGGRPPREGANGLQDEDHGRPVEQVAKELGVTPEKFREVFKKVRPAGPGQQPTEEQRQANRKILSEGLGVSPERLDEVMDKYRPGGKTNQGPRPPQGGKRP